MTSVGGNGDFNFADQYGIVERLYADGMMTSDSWKETLSRAGIAFAPGLTAAELRHAEEMHGFMFPEDLAELLRLALPVSKGWPNWREPRSESIVSALAWPLEGLMFDIQN